MAQYIGITKGNGQETSRLVTKDSGIKAAANGLNIGAEVEITHEDGADVLKIYVTGGSKGGQKDLIYKFKEIN